jgi:hypothetical protein
MLGGISLGKYCIVNTGHYRQSMEESLKRDTVRHEAIGHTAQSRMLGWLYLIVIGLPSFMRAAFFGYRCYYDFYTEKWADKLAGIDRNKSSSPFHKAYIEVISLPDLKSKLQYPTKSIPKTREEKIKVYIKVCEKFDRIKK